MAKLKRKVLHLEDFPVVENSLPEEKKKKARADTRDSFH